jgi:C-terminal processing protease CtpA/Prc
MTNNIDTNMSTALNTSSSELSASSVIMTGAGALAIAAATLISLCLGWDYFFAVQAGCATSLLLAWLCWHELPAERTGDRAAAALAGTLAGALLCVYVLAKFDRGLLPIHGALAGLTVGFVMFVLLPARYVLARAQAMPNAGGLMLFALTLAPITLGLVDYALNDATYTFLSSDDPPALPYCRATMLVAALGFVFALRRRMFVSAWTMLGVFACVCGVLCLNGHFKAAAFCAVGAAAGTWVLVALVRLHRTHAGSGPLSVKTRIVLAVTAAGIALLICQQAGPLVVAACAMWPLLSEPSERGWNEHAVAETPTPPFLPPLGMTGTLFGLPVALCSWLCAYVFLVPAAFSHWTAPALLAELHDSGLWTVSEKTFATVMMRDQYLWRDEVGQRAPTATNSASMLIYNWRYERDQWSDSETLDEVRRYDAGEAVGYGFDVGGSQPSERFRIAYVFDGSPAQKAGMRRGDTIVAVQGIPASQRFLQSPIPGWLGRDGSAHFKLVTPQGAQREVAISEAPYPAPAVTAEKVLDVEGHKVGYIALRHFVRKARWEFDEAAQRVREQGIEELVLDLRMNGGGYLYAAQGVASMIGGARAAGRPFLKLIHNSRYRELDTVERFEHRWDSLSLARVFVITSRHTCSASEALIQGLSPYMDVITVGGKTCGKPVGSSTVTYGKQVYNVITFKSVNARGEGDYYGGLAPMCPAPDDLTHELGDPEEASLRAALHYIRFGRCPGAGPDNATATGV